MSRNKTIKRIALLATASLGFGLLSVVPARAAAIAVVDTASLSTVTTPSDPSLSVTMTDSTGNEVAATIRTREEVVYLDDLELVVTGTASDDDTDTYTIAVTTDGVEDQAAYSSKEVATGTDADAVETAFDAVDLDTLTAAGGGAGGVTHAGDDSISVENSTYYVYIRGDGVALGDAFNSAGTDDILITLTLVQTSAAAVTATFDTTTTSIAGRIGQQITITPTADLTTLAAASASHAVLRVASSMSEQPNGSSVQPTVFAVDSTTAIDSDLVFANTGNTIGTTAVATTTGDAATGLIPSTINYSARGNLAVSGSDKSLAAIKFVPTHIGTYKLTVWNESSTSGTASLTGAESYQVFTITVASGVSTISLASKGTSVCSTAGTAYGCLVSVTIKDSNGVAAALSAGEVISVDPSGTGDVRRINGTAVDSDAGAAYSLTNADFTAGVAYVNIVDAADETVNVVATWSGNASVTANTSITFYDQAAPTEAPGVALTSTQTTGRAGSTDTFTVPFSFSVTYKVTDNDDGDAGDTAFADTDYVTISVLDTAGKITGLANAIFDAAVVNGGTLTVSGTMTTAAEAFRISDQPTVDSTPDDVHSSAAISFTGIDKTTTDLPSNIRVATGGTVTAVITVKDQFSRAYANGRVTLSIAGRNAAKSATGTTNADGKVSLSYTDAGTATSALTTDTITYTAYDEAGATDTATVTVTWADTAVSTVTLVAPADDDTVEGTTSTDIAAGATGATGGVATVTATVKDANGAVIVGVPVTFAVSGLTGAEVLTTTATVYTDSLGKAAASIVSYAAGKVTVTATAGGKSTTNSVWFKQKTATEARTIEASVSGGLVTATVKDRYGNTIEGVVVNATRTGDGYFGSGASTSSGTTDKNGQVEFIYKGTGTVKVAFSDVEYGQSADAAGKVGATAVTASAAGDTVTAQKGLGASLAPAGVNSASVAVSAPDASATAAEAAADAAAEAIDAANAATDAANLAAEAADAATVAAEEARDAADAATAAVEELAASFNGLVAAVKAQITTLANTVAKIAKKVKA